MIYMYTAKKDLKRELVKEGGRENRESFTLLYFQRNVQDVAPTLAFCSWNGGNLMSYGTQQKIIIIQ